MSEPQPSSLVIHYGGIILSVVTALLSWFLITTRASQVAWNDKVDARLQAVTLDVVDLKARMLAVEKEERR